MIGEVGALDGDLVPNAMGLTKQYMGSKQAFFVFATIAVAMLDRPLVIQIRWTRICIEKAGRAQMV